jgi:MFS family permease
VTWVLLSEIFPNRVRGLAMSLGTLALWIACFLLTYTFPLLNASLGASGSFLLYGVICAMGFIYVLRNVPETKGVTLEALEEQLAAQHTKVGASTQPRSAANGWSADATKRTSADVRRSAGRFSIKPGFVTTSTGHFTRRSWSAAW